MHVMVLLGGVLSGLAGIALLLQLAVPRFAVHNDTPAAATCLLILAFCGPGAVGMFISALITLWPALATDRIFDEYRRGEVLADWHFTPLEWHDHVQAESARLTGTGVLPWLWLVGPVAVIAVIILWMVFPDGAARVANVTMVVAGAAVALWLIRQVQKAVFRRKIDTMRRNPRVLIGPNSVYSDGIFNPWNVGLLVLQRVRVLPGPPMMLELTIGTGRVAQAASAALAVASLTGGSAAAGGALANMRSQTLVPVPAAKQDDVARVVEALLSPLSPMPAPVQADRAPSRALRPRAVRRPHPRRWWLATSAMFVTGFVSFLLGYSPDRHPSSLQSAASVAGLFLWIGGVVAASLAVLASIRIYWSRGRPRPPEA